MTYNDLIPIICAMTDDEKNLNVVVYPPVGCPASELVPVTEIAFIDGLNRVGKTPVIMTGKPYKSGI